MSDIGSRTPMLEEAVFGIFSEVQRGANTVATSMRSGWQDYFALRQVRSENEQLKQQLGELRVRLQEERGLAQQTQSLQKLLDLKTSTTLSTAAATVIAGGASPSSARLRSTGGPATASVPTWRSWRRRESLAGSFSPARVPRKTSF